MSDARYFAEAARQAQTVKREAEASKQKPSKATLHHAYSKDSAPWYRARRG